MARIEDYVFARVIQAGFIPPDLPLTRQQPVLIPSLTVAGVQCDRFVQILLVSRRIQAHLPGRGLHSQVTDFSGGDCLSRNKQLWVHIFDVPSKGMTLKTVTKLFAITDITEVTLQPNRQRRERGREVQE